MGQDGYPTTVTPPLGSDPLRPLARLAPKASMEAVRDAWARGLSVTVLEDGKIVSIAPDGTRTFVKEVNPL